MPDFSTILQAPDIRALVQENILERAFHDALFPRLLFRGEASPVLWPANVGDSMVFTGVGLIRPKLRPLMPGDDPIPSDYTKEQWSAQLQQYADSIDSHMPSSIVAIASLFYRNSQQMGLSAGQTLNRLPRNRMYNAALSGQTVADGTQASSVTIRVKRLNGLTRARRPDLAAGSPVKFDTVTTSNPLSVSITALTTLRNIVGFTPDTAGDEVGPGTITLSAAIAVTDRDLVIASDRSFIHRVGGGNRVDDVGAADVLTLADIRTVVAHARQNSVPPMPDGRYHFHLDPVSETQIYADAEFGRLLTSLPDYYMYRDFAIGELLGNVFFRNTECPQISTVEDGETAVFTQDDPFAGELFNTGLTTGVQIHRPLLVGHGGVLEYYQDLSQLITEAGVVGKIGAASITNNGIEVNTDRIHLIIRAPLNRLQDKVATSWKFIGDWPVRTDVTSGDVSRFKRLIAIEHGSA